MRSMSIIRVCVLLGGAVLQLAGQQPATGLACAVDVPILGYRGLVWSARVTGEALAVVEVGAGGVPAKVNVDSPQPLLVSWLKATLSSAAFLPACAGQNVKIRFIYELNGDPAPEPINEFRLKAGNTFVITARPPIPAWHPEPGTIKSRKKQGP